MNGMKMRTNQTFPGVADEFIRLSYHWVTLLIGKKSRFLSYYASVVMEMLIF